MCTRWYFSKTSTKNASKKAYTNLETDSDCFWWSVKIALICNRDKEVDYKKSEKEVKKELHEAIKEKMRN